MTSCDMNHMCHMWPCLSRGALPAVSRVICTTSQTSCPSTHFSATRLQTQASPRIRPHSAVELPSEMVSVHLNRDFLQLIQLPMHCVILFHRLPRNLVLLT